MEKIKVGDRIVLEMDYDFAKCGSCGTVKNIESIGIDVLFDEGQSIDDNFWWFICNKNGYKKIEFNNKDQTSFETQKKQVLTHLQNSPITSWEAINTYRITRLSAVIYELRKTHTITSEWEHSGKKRWTKYTLIK